MSQPARGSAPSLRLCTWNLHLGIELDDVLVSIADSDDFAGIDLLALQEASVHDGVEDAATIARHLGPDYRHVQVEAHILRGFVQANALVWNSKRVTVLQHDVLPLPRRLEHQLSRTERTLLSVLPLQQRMFLVFDCLLAGHTTRVYVAHLDVMGYRHKLLQFDRILEDVASREPVDITILAGDLNTFKMGTLPRWTRLRSAAEEAGFEDLTTEIKWTHRGRVPSRQKLDAVFVKCERSLLYDSWSIDLPGSDHIPVFAELRGWGDLR